MQNGFASMQIGFFLSMLHRCNIDQNCFALMLDRCKLIFYRCCIDAKWFCIEANMFFFRCCIDATSTKIVLHWCCIDAHWFFIDANFFCISAKWFCIDAVSMQNGFLSMLHRSKNTLHRCKTVLHRCSISAKGFCIDAASMQDGFLSCQNSSASMLHRCCIDAKNGLHQCSIDAKQAMKGRSVIDTFFASGSSMLRADSDAKLLCSGWCKQKPKKRPLENLPQPNNFASKIFIDAKKFRRRAKIIDTNFASVHGHSKNTDAALMQKIFFASPCTDACITTLHRCWTGACIDAALMHASVSSIFLGGSNKIFSLWWAFVIMLWAQARRRTHGGD